MNLAGVDQDVLGTPMTPPIIGEYLRMAVEQ
jgi:hypothetical protein